LRNCATERVSTFIFTRPNINEIDSIRVKLIYLFLFIFYLGYFSFTFQPYITKNKLMHIHVHVRVRACVHVCVCFKLMKTYTTAIIINYYYYYSECQGRRPLLNCCYPGKLWISLETENCKQKPTYGNADIVILSRVLCY